MVKAQCSAQPNVADMPISQVHADASNYASGLSKQEAYTHLLTQAEALFEGQRNWVCNLANTASLLYHLYHSLPAPCSAVNWAGFYVLDQRSPTSTHASSVSSPSSTPSQVAHAGTSKPKQKQLILGPFIGKVACQTILFGRGVCGAAAATGQTQLVPDVHAFPGHIACDGNSRSEIVVPIFASGGGSAAEGMREVIAIIDIDCAELAGFDDVDAVNLEALAALLSKSCDF